MLTIAQGGKTHLGLSVILHFSASLKQEGIVKEQILPDPLPTPTPNTHREILEEQTLSAFDMFLITWGDWLNEEPAYGALGKLHSPWVQPEEESDEPHLMTDT